uniref:Large ribosomal subunit protein bL20c n=1 Tax=Aureoumbra lagunensis TaxID=44058 RepID=C6KJ40_9STRA|nr:50S ribosomal protein L20 [Aureoumbra lagunensis]ACS36996.1 50S ribosomal protein L20 [Aureoumbra lagunensis]
MVRVKRGSVAKKRRKAVLKLAKGYKGAHSRLFRTANQQVLKAKRYSYVSRKLFKRTQRRNWIAKINSQVRRHGKTYSEVSGQLKRKKIALNRKVLANIILNDPLTFDYIIVKNL